MGGGAVGPGTMHDVRLIEEPCEGLGGGLERVRVSDQVERRRRDGRVEEPSSGPGGGDEVRSTPLLLPTEAAPAHEAGKARLRGDDVSLPEGEEECGKVGALREADDTIVRTVGGKVGNDKCKRRTPVRVPGGGASNRRSS